MSNGSCSCQGQFHGTQCEQVRADIFEAEIGNFIIPKSVFEGKWLSNGFLIQKLTGVWRKNEYGSVTFWPFQQHDDGLVFTVSCCASRFSPGWLNSCCNDKKRHSATLMLEVIWKHLEPVIHINNIVVNGCIEKKINLFIKLNWQFLKPVIRVLKFCTWIWAFFSRGLTAYFKLWFTLNKVFQEKIRGDYPLETVFKQYLLIGVTTQRDYMYMYMNTNQGSFIFFFKFSIKFCYANIYGSFAIHST